MNNKIFEKFSINDWLTLVNINKAIVSELQLDKVLILILKNALDSISAESGSLMLFDKKKSDELKIVAAVGLSEDIIQNTRIKLGDGISGIVAQTGESLLITNIKEHKEFYNNFERYKTDSCISVPLKFKTQILGVFNVNNKKDGKDFDEKDMIFADTLAQQAAIAIENAKMYMQVKKSKADLEVLNTELEESLFALSEYTEELYTFHEFTKDIFDCVISNFDIDQITTDICKLFIDLEILSPDKIVLDFKESDIFKSFDKSKEMIDLTENEHNIVNTIYEYVLKNNESIRLPFEEERYLALEELISSQYSSVMAFPILGKDGISGTLMLMKCSEGDHFDEKSRNLMSIFMLQVSTAFSLVTAMNEVMRKKVVENEMKVAAKIQKMFLPKSNPVIPGFEISHINIPTFDVGGDYIDFLNPHSRNIGIAVGDVSGKGVPASLIMALTKSAVKSYVNQFSSPKKLLETINLELLSEIEGHRFVTMIYGMYDWEKRRLLLAKAGHNPPYIFKKSGEVVRINSQGLFLGMFRDCLIKEVEYFLEKDDVVVFYTDGVTECENFQGNQYGEDRLIKLIKRNVHENAENIKKIVLDDLNKFSNGADQKDDISLVIGKCLDFYNRSLTISSKKLEINIIHNYMLSILGTIMEISDEIEFKIRIIIDEILSNAIEHGNGMDSAKKIYITHSLENKKICFEIRDEGNGFDWKKALEKNPVENIKSDRGRGLIILKNLCEEFYYNEKGNKAFISFRLEGE